MGALYRAHVHTCLAAATMHHQHPSTARAAAIADVAGLSQLGSSWSLNCPALPPCVVSSTLYKVGCAHLVCVFIRTAHRHR